MLDRLIASSLAECLGQFPAVCLLGPRQVGKTTLARLYGRDLAGKAQAEYLDLESPVDLEKLQDVRGYLSRHEDKLVILDEVQRAPELFAVLRGVIDERVLSGKRAGHFLFLGSASIDLLKQSSETLAGRIAYLEMTPFTLLETEPEQQDLLWSRGGFPMSFLAADDAASARWRAQFITTYLERDIPQLGPRIPAETLRRFWTMLAHSQGSLLNAAQLARSLAVDGKTIANYLYLMTDLMLIRRLQPYHANVKKRLVKAPKTYVRDSGLLHNLLRIETFNGLFGHPIIGMSWEGFVIETLVNAAPPRSEAYFYRTATGQEIDLILQLPAGKTYAIEIKHSSAPKLEKNFQIALDDIKPDKAFIVYNGRDRYPKSADVEAIGLRELAEMLRVEA